MGVGYSEEVSTATGLSHNARPPLPLGALCLADAGDDHSDPSLLLMVTHGEERRGARQPANPPVSCCIRSDNERPHQQAPMHHLLGESRGLKCQAAGFPYGHPSLDLLYVSFVLRVIQCCGGGREVGWGAVRCGERSLALSVCMNH